MAEQLTQQELAELLVENSELKAKLAIASREIGKLADELDSIRRLFDDLRASISKV